MTTIYMDCPQCGDEIEFKFQLHTADDGQTHIAEDIDKQCGCEIDLDALETEAVEKITYE